MKPRAIFFVVGLPSSIFNLNLYVWKTPFRIIWPIRFALSLGKWEKEREKERETGRYEWVQYVHILSCEYFYYPIWLGVIQPKYLHIKYIVVFDMHIARNRAQVSIENAFGAFMWWKVSKFSRLPVLIIMLLWVIFNGIFSRIFHNIC